MYIAKIILLISTLVVSGCITSNNTKVTRSGDVTFRHEVVLQQTGSSDPVISNHDRSFWVNLRNNSVTGEQKLYAALAAGEYKVAEQDAYTYLKKNPKNQVALNVLALSLLLNKNYSLAKYYAKQYETYYGETAETLNIKALAEIMTPNVKMLDYQNALSLLHKAFDSSSTEIASGLNLGHLYLELGNARSAATIFENVKGRSKKDIQAYLGAGIAYSRLREYGRAKSNFEAVLSSNPENSQALYRMALLEKNANNNNVAAKSYLQKLLAVSKDQGIRHRANAFLRQLESEVSRKSRVADLPKEENDTNMETPVIHFGD